MWYSPTIFLAPFVQFLKLENNSPGFLILRDVFPNWALDLGIIPRGPVYWVLNAIARYQYSVADIIGVQSNGNLAYFDYLNPSNKKTITVQSGIILGDLLEIIESKGWCIPCLPDINTITIGGALATGTHGTSGKLLSEYTTKFRIILANGAVKTITDKDELINAIRVSLGVLGVLASVCFLTLFISFCDSLIALISIPNFSKTVTLNKKWL